MSRRTCKKCFSKFDTTRCGACSRKRALLWAKQNKEKRNQRCRHTYSIFPAKRLAYVNNRRARKLQATPLWANTFFIEEIYHLATLRTKLSGFAWEVDHIVPLQGKRVCGLHVENNLQVIPASKNRSKGNKHVS